MLNLLNEPNAVRFFLEKTGMYPTRTIYINEHRYCIIYLHRKEKPIALVMKREPFWKFGQMFEENGVGDSINCNDLSLFIQHNVERIYTTFKDGKIYYIDLDLLLDKSHRWLNKEGKWVRSYNIRLYTRC